MFGIETRKTHVKNPVIPILSVSFFASLPNFVNGLFHGDERIIAAEKEVILPTLGGPRAL